MANFFLEHWIIPLGISSYFLMDNRPQFASKFFVSICAYLGAKHLATTVHHPQTNGRAERYNRTIITRLRPYVAEQQRNWKLCVLPFTYAYNTQIHCSTYTSLYNLELSRHPPGPSLLRASINKPIPNEIAISPQMMRKLIQACIIALRTKVDTHTRKWQARYRHDYDRRGMQNTITKRT